jgi:hypothetical protein
LETDCSEDARSSIDEATRFVEAVKRGIISANNGEFLTPGEVWEEIERILQS